jgi:hypothetical protein
MLVCCLCVHLILKQKDAWRSKISAAEAHALAKVLLLRDSHQRRPQASRRD